MDACLLALSIGDTINAALAALVVSSIERIIASDS